MFAAQVGPSVRSSASDKPVVGSAVGAEDSDAGLYRREEGGSADEEAALAFLVLSRGGSTFPAMGGGSGAWLGRCQSWRELGLGWAFVGYHVLHARLVASAPGLMCSIYIYSPFNCAGKATRVGGEPGITRAVMSRIQVGVLGHWPRALHMGAWHFPRAQEGVGLPLSCRVSLHLCSH